MGAVLPVALAWFARPGHDPERLLGTAAISIVGAPILVRDREPPVPAERSGLWRSAIRHSMAVVIVVFLPLCLASMLAGGGARALKAASCDFLGGMFEVLREVLAMGTYCVYAIL